MSEVRLPAPPRTAWALALGSIALVLYPFLYCWLENGARAGFSTVHGDSFLYLAIARNSHFGWFSFDGSTVTNGFHPLWQYILTFFFQGQPAEFGEHQTLVTTLLSAACTAVGTALTTVTIFRITGSRLLALATIPGLYYMLFGVLVANHSIWSEIGGMESGLSVLCGGMLFFAASPALREPSCTLDQLVDQRGLNSVFLRLGLCLPFMVLARLDDVFVLVCLSALPLLSSRPFMQRVFASARVALPSGIVLITYMVQSKLSAGSFLPISGMTKAGFVMHKTLFITLASFFPLLVSLKNAISDKSSSIVDYYQATFRCVELIVPALVAGLFIYLRRAQLRISAQSALLGAIASGVIIKTFYNLANVNLWHQGAWYFAFNVLSVSVLGALMLRDTYAGFSLGAKRFCGVLLGAWIALTSAREAIAETQASGGEYQYWVHRTQTAEALSKLVPDPKLVAFDDGITGYAMPFSTIHGFGFAADIATFRALQERRLLAHAYERGHRILTSAVYTPMFEAVDSSDALRDFLKDSILEENVQAELDSFDYRLLYIQPDLAAPFIEFFPRKTAQR